MGAEIHENGAASNGHSRAHSQFVGGRQLIDRTEYVRVLQQSLHRLGYPQAAQSLQSESGVEMQPRHVSSFQAALHEGRWADSLELLPGLAPDAETQKQARFCILRQKYIEAWEQGDLQMALHTLRSELAPLQINAAEVRMLSGLLLQAPDSPDRPGMDWAPVQPATRQALVVSLQRLLPPTLMVPDGRLEQLLEQALDAQIQACPYYNVPPATLSLLSNYQAGIEQLPTQQTQVLEGHSDEIWHVAFSHDGRHLGTASKDGSACLWAVKARGEALLSHTLPADSGPGPPKSLSFLAFSPDDSMLLTCGSAHEVKLWDVARGKLLREYKGPTQHTDQVTAVAWLPDGQSFLSSSLDRTVKRFSIDGTLQQTWRLQRINDMVLTPDGQALLYIAVDKKINVLRLKEDREVLTLTDGPAITSLAVAPGGAYLIAHMVAHTLQLWPLASISSRLQAIAPAESPARNAGEVVGMPTKPSMEYKVEGGRHGRFIIRSCFGGNNANFIASGSEDCRVHIWHRASGDLLARLEGHSGTVNSVAWNPTNPHMLASASDDKTVRIWMAPAAIERNS